MAGGGAVLRRKVGRPGRWFARVLENCAQGSVRETTQPKLARRVSVAELPPRWTEFDEGNGTAANGEALTNGCHRGAIGP